MSKRRNLTGVCLGALILCLAFCGSALAVNVDMDPVPRIPLRPGESQHFLVHLSGAKTACSGAFGFPDLPDGLTCEPKRLEFKLKPGESKLLVFKITNTKWGEMVTIRPKLVAAAIKEPVNFPENLKTQIVRDKKMLDKKPVGENGLLFYYSCGDGEPYRASYLVADKAAGRAKMWDEGMWIAPGGVKGNCFRGANGDMKSKAAFDPLNSVDHRGGTITCWIRKEEKIGEMGYWDATRRMKYDDTWKFGPKSGHGGSGEGIFGGNWTPQTVAARRLKRATGRDWKAKSGSDGFIGLRRYKAFMGKPGYLEAVYQALQGRKYSVRAPFAWTERWQHVAVVWDMEARRLEIWIDGKKANDAVRMNGKPAPDEPWYGAPWSVALPDNAAFSVVQHRDEGGRSLTRRDEFAVYNQAFGEKEIIANMKASMGKVVTPILLPEQRDFHDSLTVSVKSHWGGVTHRYTLDGVEPNEKSPEYKGPITLEKSSTLKVRSYLEGFQPSDVATAEFAFFGLDKTKPEVARVLAFNDPNTVLVIFNKDVDKATAEDVKNYGFEGKNKIVEAKLGPHRRVVRLKTLRPLGPGKVPLSISGIKDASKSGNVMDATLGTVELKHLPGLTAWWSFDALDGPALKDLGPLGITGTAYHDVNIPKAVRVPGRYGKALYIGRERDFAVLTKFAKDPGGTNLDDRSVDQKSPLNTDNGSVCLWVKVKPRPRGGGTILNKTYAYTLRIYRNCLMVSGNGWRSKAADPNMKIADGKWHHVALTFQNKVKDGAKVYIDGELKTAVTPRFLRHIYTRLQLCAPVGWGGGLVYLDGAIDDVMFFGRVLSDAEVKKLFETGFLSAAK